MPGRGSVGRFLAGCYPAAAQPSPELQKLEPLAVADHDSGAISIKIARESAGGAIQA
jgi:hypothetical protein